MVGVEIDGLQRGGVTTRRQLPVHAVAKLDLDLLPGIDRRDRFEIGPDSVVAVLGMLDDRLLASDADVEAHVVLFPVTRRRTRSAPARAVTSSRSDHSRGLPRWCSEMIPSSCAPSLTGVTICA